MKTLPPPNETRRWTLLLVPCNPHEDSDVHVAAILEAPDTIKAAEIVYKLRMSGIPATGINQITDQSRKKQGLSSPVQIQEVPSEDSVHWEGIPAINKAKLIELAVFSTQNELAALLGVPTSSITCSLYNARKRNKNASAVVKGFRIARLEDLYKD